MFIWAKKNRSIIKYFSFGSPLKQKEDGCSHVPAVSSNNNEIIVAVFLTEWRFLDTIYFDVATKNPKIVLDGNNYLIYRKESIKTVWKCSHYFRSKENRCKSTLVTTGRVVSVSADLHNHPPPPQKNDKLKNMLWQRVTIIREARDQ